MNQVKKSLESLINNFISQGRFCLSTNGGVFGFLFSMLLMGDLGVPIDNVHLSPDQFTVSPDQFNKEKWPRFRLKCQKKKTSNN